MYFALFFIILVTINLNIFSLSRPSSEPFISGDTFRKYCDFVLDEASNNFNPAAVKLGDTIFVGLKYLDKFFDQYHSKIKGKYILVSHNEDCSTPGKFKKFLDDHKLVAWFTQNMDISRHPKVIPIPIGLSNQHLSCGHSRNNVINITNTLSLRKVPVIKKHLLYCNFDFKTSPKTRSPIYTFFKKKGFCSWSSKKKYVAYLNDLALSKFVLCPHGNGLDCHRTWETLYMGSFPLVKCSTLDALYDGLPVLIVDDWKDVTMEFLSKKYEEMSGKIYKFEKLYFYYWLNLIKEYQQKLRMQVVHE